MSLFFLYMFILILFLLGKFLVDEHAEQAHRWLEATSHLPKNRRAHHWLALRYRARWQPWSRARMPWPTSLCLSWLADGRRGVGGWSSSQQPPEAQRVAQMEVADAQNLQAAACRRREADPVGGRRRREAGQWRASDELCRGQRRPASLRPARGCHSF